MADPIADAAARLRAVANGQKINSAYGMMPIAALTAFCADIHAVLNEMERRDRNETRNCINYGPCSRHDGRMSDG